MGIPQENTVLILNLSRAEQTTPGHLTGCQLTRSDLQERGGTVFFPAWVFYGNPIEAWLIALAIAATVYLLQLLLLRVALVRLHAVAQHTATQVDNLVMDVLSKTRWWFMACVSIYAGSLYVILPADVSVLMRNILVIVVTLQVAVWGHHLITEWLTTYFRRKYAGDKTVQTMTGAVVFLGRMLFYTALLLMALQNMGVRIDTLLAGLGIGGVAVALSVQNILGDLFASLSIVFDQPFLVGDFIILDNGMMGTVEHVGLKTTRLTSLNGEELVIANNDLLKTRIRNYRKMKDRLVNFKVSVPFQTPHEKLKALPDLFREVIEAHPRARFEWARLASLGPYAFEFDVAYYVTNYEWYSFMEIREEIYLEIIRRLTDAGVELAYPTQTLFAAKPSPQ